MAPSNHDIIRYKEVRRADAMDDQKTAAQILAALGASVTQEDLQQFLLSQLKRVIFGDAAGSWNSDFLSAGILSLSQLASTAPESVIKVHFSYTTPSPLVLQAVTAGSVIDRAALLITTPFDDPSASLRLGTTANPDFILGAAENGPTQAGQYDTLVLSEFGVSDLLRLIITPAASTQGAGLLLYKIRS